MELYKVCFGTSFLFFENLLIFFKNFENIVDKHNMSVLSYNQQGGKAMEQYTPKQLAEISGKTVQTIYYYSKKLKRLPTLEEIKDAKVGRPRKNF
jgi:hypothetical protein